MKTKRVVRTVNSAEAELASLLPALKVSLVKARKSLRGGLGEAQSVLSRLRSTQQ
jgi:hypothetical protein